MQLLPCPNGRMQAAVLAMMNRRAVVGLNEVTYVATSPRKLAAAPQLVGPRFQPRDEAGRFVPYAYLWEAINAEYAWTAYEYDVEDEAIAEERASTEDF